MLIKLFKIYGYLKYLLMYLDEALEISYRHEEVRRITTISMLLDLEKPKFIGKNFP